MVKKKNIKRELSGFEQTAFKVTEWIGSTSSILVHTIFFVLAFALILVGVRINTVLLILTTAVSLEAIYLAIFIQMTVNRNTASLQEVEEDIDEIQEDVEEIEKDIDEIQVDVDEMEKDFDRWEEEELKEEQQDAQTEEALDRIKVDLDKLLQDIADLKQSKK